MRCGARTSRAESGNGGRDDEPGPAHGASLALYRDDGWSKPDTRQTEGHPRKLNACAEVGHDTGLGKSPLQLNFLCAADCGDGG